MKSKCLLPIRSVVFILAFVLGALVTGKAVADISSWWSVMASLINVFTIVMLVVIARKNGMTYKELINLKKGQTGEKHIGIIVLMVVVGMAGLYLAGFICYGVLPYSPPKVVEPIPLVLAILNVIVLPITTALAEDGLYLGLGVNHIKNKYLAVIVPAFFYAFQHCFIPVLWDVRYMVYRFISFLPLTVMFCIYYYKKRNPLPCMIAHVILDIATAVTILSMSVVPGLYEQLCNM